MDTRTCRVCGNTFPLTNKYFAFCGKWRGSFDRQCRKCRDRKGYLHAKGNQRKLCEKGILKRQATNSSFCLVSERERYSAVSHMLDDFGFVKPEFKGTYEGFIRLSVGERQVRENAAARKLFEKNALKGFKRISEIPEREPKTVLLTAERIAESLYQRVRYRLKKYARKYAISVPLDMRTLNGRTVDDFFRQSYGYSVSELMSHLERTFPPKTHWYDFMVGSVQLDHKTPIANFDITSVAQLRNCYSLSNLQLMLAEENSRKGAYCDLTGEKVTVALRKK